MGSLWIPTDMFDHFVQSSDVVGAKTNTGHFIYACEDDLLVSEANMDLGIELKSNNTILFASTRGNKVKLSHRLKTPLKTMPTEVKEVLKKAFNKVEDTLEDLDNFKELTEENLVIPKYLFMEHLGKQIEDWLNSTGKQRKILPTRLARAFTPQRSRFFDTETNSFTGIQPANIPKGGGNDYMVHFVSRVAGDRTVGPKLAERVVLAVNALMEEPYPEEEAKYRINRLIDDDKPIYNKLGERIWQFDPTIDKSKLLLRTEGPSEWIEPMFSQLSQLFYIVYRYENKPGDSHLDPDTGSPRQLFSSHTSASSILTALRASYNGELKMGELMNCIPSYEVHFEPERPEGAYGNKKFNLFRPTIYSRYMQDPSLCPYNNQEPTMILGLLENLFDDPKMLDFFLRFVYTKFSTFKYSCITPIIVGVPGSGKSTLAQILVKLAGTASAVIPPDVFSGTFHDHIPNSLLVLVEEIPEASKKGGGVIGATSRIMHMNYKRISGGQTISVNPKGEKLIKNVTQHNTLVVTSNDRPWYLADDDRRALVVKAKRSLESRTWVQRLEGGGSEVRDVCLSHKEICKFCCWLSNNYEILPEKQYNARPYRNADFDWYVSQDRSMMEKLVHYIKTQQYKELWELGLKYNKDLFASTTDKVWLSDICEMYEIYTLGDKYAKKDLDQAQMRAFLLDSTDLGPDSVKHTSRGQERNQYYIPFPGMRRWAVKDGSPYRHNIMSDAGFNYIVGQQIESIELCDHILKNAEAAQEDAKAALDKWPAIIEDIKAKREELRVLEEIESDKLTEGLARADVNDIK